MENNNKELNGIKMMIADGIVTQEAAEKYFPELKKSKDERTQLTEFLWDLIYKGSSFRYHREDFERWKSWLEKQGEQNPYSGVSFEYNGHTWGMCARDNGVDILLDKQLFKHLVIPGEQKADEKVEPKFHKEDFVVDKDGRIYQITRIEKDFSHITYACSLVENPIFWFLYLEREIRKWDITKDAKAGDVLADGNLPFIFKKIDTNKHIYAYCGISVDDGFRIESDGKSGEWTWMQDIKPATKEQRDALFVKMKEVGYEWDANKKELKKLREE